MPYIELLKWIDFFSKYPIGWREDQRTYAMLKSWGLKASPENTFPTLKQLKESQMNKKEPDRAVPSGKILDMMLAAKNGDSDWKPNMGKKNG